MTAPWLDSAEGAGPQALHTLTELPQSLTYRAKRRLLGPPLTRDSLRHQRLNKKLALGVLSSDCISSSAYGSEEMLIVLLPVFGVAAFTILMPLTFVILAVLLVVSLCYLDVVSIYTKAGGSYVVARENFGPAVAQIGAVALMLDYIVTVAVQSAAGTAALTSAVPGLSQYTLEISVGVVLILFYGNLRGLREAGRAFAIPTYLFVFSMGAVILLGLIREAFGDLPQATLQSGTVPIGPGHSVVTWFALFVLLKSFANGGSSLTGLEAISNGVGAFEPPEGRNARKTLVVMSCILGFLVLGVSWLAHETHATPYDAGTPTVISQVAQTVLGNGVVGHALFLFVQIATMLILYTGANTPFNGFPFLTSFVAEDQFLPKQLTKRGHRLAFSNGIIVLAICSVTLLLATDAKVDKLVAFYAIGVFTGFTLAGFGMWRYFRRVRPTGWKRKSIVNFISGSVSMLVVLIFAVVKFTEGAWLVIIIFPVGVLALIRLNRQYRREAAALSAISDKRSTANITRHTTIILVDEVDLATIGAVRYARSMNASEIRAVHFVIDDVHADQIRAAWPEQRALASIPLQLIDCPDRRLTRAALELAQRASVDPGTEVTLLLPRRTYSPVLGRLLHDRTADDIAGTVSRLPRVVATIVPFDVNGILTGEVGAVGVPRSPVAAPTEHPRAQRRPAGERSAPVPDEVSEPLPIAELVFRQRATVVGKVRSVRATALSGAPSLEVEVWDSSGGITLVFYGRRSIHGIRVGAAVRATGRVGELHGALSMSNPLYELVNPELVSATT